MLKLKTIVSISFQWQIGAQMLQFLLQFLEMFPELRSAPLFIAGQSYAGKYVPALGIQIHRYNTEILRRNEKNTINFRVSIFLYIL